MYGLSNQWETIKGGWRENICKNPRVSVDFCKALKGFPKTMSETMKEKCEKITDRYLNFFCECVHIHGGYVLHGRGQDMFCIVEEDD